MKHLSTSSHLVVRLSPGDFLPQAIEAAMKERHTQNAAVLAGIGSVRQVEVGTHTEKGPYRRRTFEGLVELLTLSGLVTGSSSTGPFQPHLHASFADEEGKVWGGHLFGAAVAMTAEIAMLPLMDTRLRRVRNEEHGVDLLEF